MSDLQTTIAANLAEVRQRMADAAMRSGRSPDAVRLVAVTKYASVEQVRALAAAGCRDLGESRPQQLWQRAPMLADLDVHWHFIGHLQRNKVERTLPLVDFVQSVDSLRLAQAIDRAGAELSRRAVVLLEVNVSGDAAKYGFAVDEVDLLLPQLEALIHLDIRGLMCMAGIEDDVTAAHRDFAALRTIRDRLGAHLPPNISLEELSMGMSGDFEIAIAEGATIVRIGTALYEGIADS